MTLIKISLKKIVDPKTGDEKPITITLDDGIRPNTTISDLAKLKPVFKKSGTTTAGIRLPFIISFSQNNCLFPSISLFYVFGVGNSSQVTDGAAAVLLMKRSVAISKGLPIIGVFRYINP